MWNIWRFRSYETAKRTQVQVIQYTFLVNKNGLVDLAVHSIQNQQCLQLSEYERKYPLFCRPWDSIGKAIWVISFIVIGFPKSLVNSVRGINGISLSDNTNFIELSAVRKFRWSSEILSVLFIRSSTFCHWLKVKGPNIDTMDTFYFL